MSNLTFAITWIGEGDGHSWNDNDNWNPNTNYPTAGDDVIIDDPITTGNFLIISGSWSCKNITFINNGIIYFASSGANTLNVFGYLVNNSGHSDIVDNSTGIIAMRGSNDNEISGSQNIELYNLKIQKFDETKTITINVATDIWLKLEVLLGILDANGFLTLRSNAGVTAYVEPTDPNYGTIINRATVQQTLLESQLYYHYLSSPVGDATSNDYYTIYNQFADNSTALNVYDWTNSIINLDFPDWLVYNESTCAGLLTQDVIDYYDTELSVTLSNAQADWVLSTFGWESNDNLLTDEIAAGNGVMSRVEFDITGNIVDWRGYLNNGEVHVATYLTSGCDFADGLNFIGNPFPSPIDFDVFAVFDYNDDFIAPYAYIWTPDASATSPFGAGFGDGYFSVMDATYTMSNIPSPIWSDESAVTSDHHIAIGQGFFVFAIDDGGVSFDTPCRVGSNTPNIRRYSKPEEALQLTVNSATAKDYTNIYLHSNANDDFNIQEDAPKMLNPKLNIATINGQKKLMVNRLGKSNDEIIVPLFVESKLGEEIIIGIGSTAFESTTYVAIFIDNKLKKQKVIDANFKYTYTQQKGDESDRFIIKFVKGNYTVNNSTQQAGSMYMSNNQLNIFAANINKAQVVLNDASGRILYQEQVIFNNGKAAVILDEISSGIYMVSVQSNADSFTQKLMINK